MAGMTDRAIAAFAAFGCGCVSIPDFHGDAGVDAPPPITANVMFVTSESHTLDLDGDRTRADAWCTELATAGHLPDNTYVAWLSKTDATAGERLRGTAARGWVRPDGKPIANGIEELIAGSMFYPPRVDERSRDLGDLETLVATGTTHYGNAYETCGDLGDPGMLVLRGLADAEGTLWTETSGGSCTPSKIFCLGTAKTEQVTVPKPAVVRRAFVSAGTILVGAGRTAFDTLCTTEATNASLPGDFLAAVASTGDSIASRFPAGGAAWTRVDDVETLSGDFATMAAPIDLDAGGNQRIVAIAAGADAFTKPGTNASTCANWSTPQGTLTLGESPRSVPLGALAADTFDCTMTDIHVLCLQK